MVWGGIIAAAQVADALQNAIPFAARYRGTSALVMSLDALFIDCQMEWEDIYAARLDEADVTKRLHAMKTHRHETLAKHLPNGFPPRKSLAALAERDAIDYLNRTYGEWVTQWATSKTSIS